ncbi:hypothetical protein WPG_0845 [Winogradskyella sp. PG-2]|nr:hypothetical protein WPG_0845 [Winogradskyella sp. PG-2]
MLFLTMKGQLHFNVKNMLIPLIKIRVAYVLFKRNNSSI